MCVIVCSPAGYADTVLSVTSSHFASAQKEFRFPLEYGGQRPLYASWTVTGSAGFLLQSMQPQETTKKAVCGYQKQIAIHREINPSYAINPLFYLILNLYF